MRDRRRQQAVVLAALAGLALPGRAHGDGNAGDGGSARSDGSAARDGGDDARYQAVVTGSRTESRLADAPVAVEVISRADIVRSGARDLAEVLATRPGVQLDRTFAGTSLSLRGLDARYVLVLVDGVRQIGRVDGALDLGRFTVDDIERIEIVRGPASALYGADAMGGVVNIITRRATRRHQAEAEVGYGSLNRADVRAGAGLMRPSFTLHVAGGYHHRDAYSLVPDSVATSGSALDQFDLAARGSYRTRQRLRLDARVEYMQRRLSGVDRGATGAIFDRRNLTETLNAEVAPEIVFAFPARLRVQAAYGLYRDQYLSDQRGSDALDSYQETREQLAFLGVQYDHVLGSHTLTLGVEGQAELLDSGRLAGGHGSRGRGAVYAQDQWTIALPGLVPAGSTASRAPRLSIVPAVRVDLDSQFGHALSPKLAVRFDPHPRVTVRGSYGRGFRPPDFKELLLHFENPGVGYVVDGNPNLKPETSESVDAAIEVTAARALVIAVSGFRNDLKNLIQASLVSEGGPGGAQRFSYVNVAAAHTQGIEASLRLGPLAGLALDIGYGFTDAVDEEHKRALEGRARHTGSAALTFVQSRWGLEATVRAALVGARPYYVDGADGATRTTWASTYVLVDARIAETLWRRLTLFIGAQNLAGAGDAALTPLVPRTFYGGVAAHY